MERAETSEVDSAELLRRPHHSPARREAPKGLRSVASNQEWVDSFDELVLRIRKLVKQSGRFESLTPEDRDERVQAVIQRVVQRAWLSDLVSRSGAAAMDQVLARLVENSLDSISSGDDGNGGSVDFVRPHELRELSEDPRETRALERLRLALEFLPKSSRRLLHDWAVPADPTAEATEEQIQEAARVFVRWSGFFQQDDEDEGPLLGGLLDESAPRRDSEGDLRLCEGWLKGGSTPDHDPDDDHDRFLRLVERVRALFAMRAPELRHPRRVDDFEILDLLGFGGMGFVYLAAQDSPVRLVALKILRTDDPSPEARRQFEYEIDVLAKLKHPNIASIVGSGIYGSSRQPYFAMEFVEGARTLTGAAAEQSLDTEGRVRLFLRACDGVEHAHQRGYIHRDLKPSNILVDSSGCPQIVDFGLSRSTERDLHETIWDLQEGRVAGTLAYMAPEQCSGRMDEVETRTDVYALGVVLYELLTGRLPVPVDRRDTEGSFERIRHQRPIPIGRHDARLRGDLEVVVAKALEKRKEDRYSGVRAFAEDLERVLRHEPPIARPPTAAHQLRLFARRHPALVIGTGTTAAAVLIGLAVSLYFLQRARDEVSRTTAAVEVLDQVLGLEPGDSATLAAIESNANQQFEERPGLASTIDFALARTYRERGQPERARQLVLRSIEHASSETSSAADQETRVGGRLELLETLDLELGRNRELTGDPGADATARCNAYINLAYAWHELGDLGRAEDGFRMASAVAPTPDRQYAANWLLGNLLVDSGKYVAATEALGAAEVALTQARSSTPGSQFWIRSIRGRLLENSGRYREAVAQYEFALGEIPAVEEHAGKRANIGLYLNALREDLELSPTKQRGRDSWVEQVAPLHEWIFVRNHGVRLWRQGLLSKGIERVVESAELARSGGDLEQAAHSLRLAASLHSQAGEFDRARELFEACLELEPEASTGAGYTHLLYGEALAAVGRATEARSQFERSRDLYEQEDHAGLVYPHRSLFRARLGLVKLESDSGARARAARGLLRDLRTYGFGGSREAIDCRELIAATEF